MPNRGRGHCIWLDNLFTSKRLLSQLRKAGIGCAGTCRTTKCKTQNETAASKSQSQQQVIPKKRKRVDEGEDLPGYTLINEEDMAVEDPQYVDEDGLPLWGAQVRHGDHLPTGLIDPSIIDPFQYSDPIEPAMSVDDYYT